MKKWPIIIILLLLGAGAFGQQLISLGTDVSFQSAAILDSEDNKTTLNTTEIGFNTIYIKGNKNLLNYSFIHLGLPLAITRGEDNQNDSVYLSMAGEGLLGVGYPLSPSKKLKIIPAAGIHINSFFYDAINNETGNWATIVYSAFGLGIGAAGIYEFSPTLTLGLNIHLGFDFIGLMFDPNDHFGGAVTLNIGLSSYSTIKD